MLSNETGSSQDLAFELLAYAAVFDKTILPQDLANPVMIEAWGEIFEGRVWPTEGKAAIRAHYAKPKAYRLMPGDVIGYCDEQPVWSSREHAADWLRLVTRNGHQDLIRDYSGLDVPRFDAPADYRAKEALAWDIEQLTAWVEPRFDDVVTAIMTKQHRNYA